MKKKEGRKINAELRVSPAARFEGSETKQTRESLQTALAHVLLLKSMGAAQHHMALPALFNGKDNGLCSARKEGKEG